VRRNPMWDKGWQEVYVLGADFGRPIEGAVWYSAARRGNILLVNVRTLPAWTKTLQLIPQDFPLKWRLAGSLLRPFLDMEDVQIQDTFGCLYTLPSLREPVAFALAVDGVYEPDLIRLARSLAKADSVVVDVGANVGSFSLPIARRLSQRGKVLAVEPSSLVFPYLARNVALNGLQNIILERYAASDRDGAEIDFYEAPKSYFGMGSHGSQFHSSPDRVQTATLDRLLEKHQLDGVDVVKVDVEGMEAMVFKGMKRLLASASSPIVVFEFAGWAEKKIPEVEIGDAQRVLREFGYSIWRLRDFLRERDPLKEILLGGYETLVAAKTLVHD
jgi:FkbM family methyltransferase